MTRLGSVLAAAVLAVATTVLPGLSVAPAEAAACTDAGGVTVVVDPGSLPGSLSQTCVGGSGKAAGLFGSAGHTLTRVQRFPGAVCKVDGEPADSGCVNMPPTNAYWGLFWSDGKSGSWVYSSAGVDNLDVPAGGSVALAWQSSSSRRNPAVKPPDHDGSGADDPGGSGGGSGGTGGSGGGGRTGGGSGGGSGGGNDGPTGGASSDAPASSSPSASDSPTSDAPKPADSKQGKRDRPADGKKSDRPREQQSQTAEPTEDATVAPDAAPAADAATTPVSQGGLPLWLVGVAAAGLLTVGTTVAVVRRRATHDA